MDRKTLPYIVIIILCFIFLYSNSVYGEKDYYFNIGLTPETGTGFGVGFEYGKEYCFAIGAGTLTDRYYYRYKYFYSFNMSYKKYSFRIKRKGSFFWAIGLGYCIFQYRKEYLETYWKVNRDPDLTYQGILFNFSAGWRAFLNERKDFAITLGLSEIAFFGWDNTGEFNFSHIDALKFIGGISFNTLNF